MNLIFLSSSDFCLPILESVLKAQNSSLSLWQVFESQYQDLIENYAQNSNVRPSWWLEPDLISNLESKLQTKRVSLNSPIKVAAVITQPNSLNHGREILNPIAKFCQEYFLKNFSEVDQEGLRHQAFQVFQPSKLNKSLDELKLLVPACDLGILASYGQILSQEVLDFPTFGLLNWHPSRLPSYRGSTPMQTAINNGDQSTALTWLEMTKAMDAGDIWLQIDTEIFPKETIIELSRKMGQIGARTWALGAVGKLLNFS